MTMVTFESLIAPSPRISLEVGATVVWLDGEQDLTAIDVLHDVITEVVARPAHDPDVIIDLSAVSFMDSRVVGALTREFAALRRSGRWMTVRGSSPMTRRLFTLCNANELLEQTIAPPHLVVVDAGPGVDDHRAG